MRGGSVHGQLMKGTTPLLILSVLRDGEFYGYEIAQRIRERSGGVFAPSEGSLYPALHALEAAGALTASWQASDKGPRRRYYRLTPTGRGLLADQASVWRTFATAVARTTGQS